MSDSFDLDTHSGKTDASLEKTSLAETQGKLPRFKLSLPEQLDFNDEFRAAFNLMETTQDCVFIAGKAGTGKSTLLQYFREKTRKQVIILAPTGVAAVNVSGQTIHSFFRFPPRLIQKEHIRRLRNPSVMERVETLVIDEVSMVRADLMDGIDYALRRNRDMPRKPFGGVQVVFIGDLFQLPPVIEEEARRILAQKYQTPYFFSAEVFQQVQPRYIELEKIYRQSDDGFIRLLNKVRNKFVGEEDLLRLNERVKKAEAPSQERITLTTTNEGAQRLNDNRLAALTTEEFRYPANIFGEFKDSSFPTEALLRLKVGAQVIMIRNDPEKRWVNGTIAEVAELTKDTIKVKVDGKIFAVHPVRWERIEHKYDEAFDRIETETVGAFEQFPLKLAWAITIHKAQGQTFNQVTIDLERGGFAHGQVYVALSRCTSLEGIILKRPVHYDDIVFDPQIYQFRESFAKLTISPSDKLNQPHFAKGQIVALFDPSTRTSAMAGGPSLGMEPNNKKSREQISKGQEEGTTPACRRGRGMPVGFHSRDLWMIEHCYVDEGSDPKFRISCGDKMKIVKKSEIG